MTRLTLTFVRARRVKEHYNFLLNHFEKLDTAIDTLAAPFESAVDLRCKIPGILRQSAITILSEIGTDMSQFGSSKKLCCWGGLTPGNNESAGKKKSVKNHPRWGLLKAYVGASRARCRKIYSNTILPNQV